MATNFHKTRNNARSVVATAYTAEDGSLVLSNSASFGSAMTPTNPLRVTVIRASDQAIAILDCTANNTGTNTLTIAGAIEGTSEIDLVVGDYVGAFITAGTIDDLQTSVNALEVAGVQGPQGNQGTTGAQGPQGFQGVAGSTGAQGNQGNQGFQGTAGSAGAQGPQGNQGNQGNQGFQGAAGAAGSQGNQGNQGNQGFQGAAGAAGPQGNQGFQGDAGAAGPQGNQGHQGNQGNQGSGVAAGSNTQIQYNSSGSFAGSNALLWDNTNQYVTIGNSTNGTVPRLIFDNDTATGNNPMIVWKHPTGEQGMSFKSDTAGVLTEILRLQDNGGVIIPNTGAINFPGTAFVMNYDATIYRGNTAKITWANSSGSTVPAITLGHDGTAVTTWLCTVMVTPNHTGVIGQVVKGIASQAANLMEWRSSADAVLSTVSENGYYTTRKVSAPADAELSASEVAFWFDDTNGAGKLKIKGKTANGTVVAGEVTLS
jgi:hypothetical protein